MKRGLATLLVMLTLLSVSVPAQTYCRRPTYARGGYTRSYAPRYTRSEYRRAYPAYGRSNVYYARDRRSFWQRHRDKLTVALGAGAGAGIGGLAGGRRGAVIGALTGGGGAALYTYGLRDRRPRYRRH